MSCCPQQGFWNPPGLDGEGETFPEALAPGHLRTLAWSLTRVAPIC